MQKSFEYYPEDVCSSRYIITLNDDVIENIEIEGGCDGNSEGLMRLLPGQTASEVIKRLSGVRCGGKSTSCPDQIACALKIMTGN